jgi:Fur family zinc uptake transcriptional regulator
VLFILWQSDKPLKAYDILNQLLKIKQNSKPPTVYRVLDYFVACGIVHKIESIQSYTLCREPEKHRSSEIVMVCTGCHQVSELYDPGLQVLVQNLSKEHQFNLGGDIIELKGVCKDCQSLCN